MKFPILVEPHNGRFQASILGSEAVSAEGSTKEEAVNSLRACIHQRIAKGELLFLDVPHRAVSEFAGLFKDDPTWEDLAAETYRERDAQKAAEWPE